LLSSIRKPSSTRSWADPIVAAIRRASPLLITGGSGYVGLATCQAALAAGYEVTATYHRHRPDLAGLQWVSLDLADAAAVKGLVADWRPGTIIHAAAAWDTPTAAEAVIVDGTRTLAAAAAAAGSRLVHLSTDMIFDGEHAPYREADPPSPPTFYGRAKAQAEADVAALVADHVIIRTSLVTAFAPPDARTAQVLASLRTPPPDENGLQADAAPRLTLFTDEYRCPVRTGDLVAALVELIEHPYRGILHIAGPERLSRYELGCRIAAHYGLDASRLASGTSAG